MGAAASSTGSVLLGFGLPIWKASLIAELILCGLSNKSMLKSRDMRNSLESCLLGVKRLFIDPILYRHNIP